MTRVTCDRCAEAFDLDRPKAYTGQDRRHCPRCGKKNEKPSGEGRIEPANPQGSTGETAGIDLEKLADAGGDVHIHLHQ